MAAWPVVENVTLVMHLDLSASIDMWWTFGREFRRPISYPLVLENMTSIHIMLCMELPNNEHQL